MTVNGNVETRRRQARHQVRRRWTYYPEQTIEVRYQNPLPLINVDPSSHLVEAAGGNPGVATSLRQVIKGDLDGTASYDTAALIADKWDNLGNGIYGKLGSYGAAALNTVGVAAATLLAAGWTDVGSGIFEKVAILHDVNGNRIQRDRSCQLGREHADLCPRQRKSRSACGRCDRDRSSLLFG